MKEICSVCGGKFIELLSEYTNRCKEDAYAKCPRCSNTSQELKKTQERFKKLTFMQQARKFKRKYKTLSIPFLMRKFKITVAEAEKIMKELI